MSYESCWNAPTTANIIHIKPTPTVASANITVTTIWTIRFVLIEAEKKATKINANGISNRKRAEISIMSCGINSIDVLLPFSFQFFTRLAAVFAEEVGGFGVVAFNGLI